MSAGVVVNTRTAPSWRRYASYRSSGIEWLTEIPQHWHLRRLKYSTDLVLEKSKENRGNRRYLGLENVESWTGRVIEADELSHTEGDSLQFKEGDVLFGKLRPYLAKSTVAQYSGRCTSEFLVLRQKSYLPSYLMYLFLSPQIVFLIDGSTFGAKMPRADWDFIGNLLLPVVDLSEQGAIVDFLNSETAKIDALIAKRERLIELLQEKRTALISHAVTKGLDPTVPMKASGIEWLGEIPEHWNLKRLKFVLTNGLVNGVFKKQDQFGSGVKLINVFDIYRDDFLIDFDSLERVEVDQEEIQRYKVEDGDIFFVRSSLKLEGVANSACAVGVSEPIVFECHIIRARPDVAKAIPKFLINFVNSKLARQRLIACSETVTMTTIDQDNLQTIEILVPPLDEQIAIVGFLDRETNRIVRLIAKVREGIERLKEYRTSLISAAVTGKIDVRSGQ